jgi:hypothetical protein
MCPFPSCIQAGAHNVFQVSFIHKTKNINNAIGIVCVRLKATSLFVRLLACLLARLIADFVECMEFVYFGMADNKKKAVIKGTGILINAVLLYCCQTCQLSNFSCSTLAVCSI